MYAAYNDLFVPVDR